MKLLGTSGRRRLGVALAGAVTAVAFAAPAAQADFTIPACGGSAIKGVGSSLQNVAQQNYLSVNFGGSEGCPGIPSPAVTYNTGFATTGSGAGLRAMGSADGNRESQNFGARFGGTDDAPTPTQQAFMNNGADAGTADDAKIHIIPIATAAVTAVVNLPDACRAVGTGAPTGDFDATSGRVQISNDKLAKAFAGVSGGQTWGDLLPTATGTCATAPVRRIVRQDSSGSTYVFKQYLNRTSPGTFDTAANTTWPNGPVTATASACTVSLCSNTASGGGSLRTLLGLTDGGIGYLALSDTRSGFDKSDALPPATSVDDTYFLQLQNNPGGSTTGYKDPALDATGWKTGGTKGSNCVSIPSLTLPAGADPTLGDWSPTNPTGGSGYPACALTWDLAFDDNAPAWGKNDTEQAKARTLKDYLTFVVSSVGQAGLLSNDYAPLSPTLLAAAQTGVNAIGWDKSSGNVVTPPPTETTPTQTTPTQTTPTQTTPTVIDNKFTLASAKVKGTAITVALKLPGAGKLAVKASFKYKGKTITFASVSASVKGGTGTVSLKAGSKAKAALKKVKSAKVTFTVTYTPTGGKANAKSKTVTVKGGKK